MATKAKKKAAKKVAKKAAPKQSAAKLDTGYFIDLKTGRPMMKCRKCKKPFSVSGKGRPPLDCDNCVTALAKAWRLQSRRKTLREKIAQKARAKSKKTAKKATKKTAKKATKKAA